MHSNINGSHKENDCINPSNYIMVISFILPFQILLLWTSRCLRQPCKILTEEHSMVKMIASLQRTELSLLKMNVKFSSEAFWEGWFRSNLRVALSNLMRTATSNVKIIGNTEPIFVFQKHENPLAQPNMDLPFQLLTV